MRLRRDGWVSGLGFEGPAPMRRTLLHQTCSPGPEFLYNMGLEEGGASRSELGSELGSELRSELRLGSGLGLWLGLGKFLSDDPGIELGLTVV